MSRRAVARGLVVLGMAGVCRLLGYARVPALPRAVCMTAVFAVRQRRLFSTSVSFRHLPPLQRKDKLKAKLAELAAADE